jgi:DNA polymerase-4
LNEIYAEYTDCVEPFGIDESWLDVTASRRIFGSGEQIAEAIRRRVKEEIGVTVSIGVSFNKVFAKLASDYKKPDAITVISKDNFKQIVFPLPVSDLLFVGKRTAEELSKIGIRTIGDLALSSSEMIKHKLGKMGDMLWNYANGFDDSPVGVNESREVKSISNGFTFKHDLVTREDCRIGIDFLCEDIGSKLRRKSLKCNTVAITIKDTRLKSIQRQRPLENASDIKREIADLAFDILCDEWAESYPIRMITVTVTGLVDSSSSFTQLDLFSDNEKLIRDKDKKKEETVDAIRSRFGSSSISSASFYSTDIGIGVKKS